MSIVRFYWGGSHVAEGLSPLSQSTHQEVDALTWQKERPARQSVGSGRKKGTGRPEERNRVGRGGRRGVRRGTDPASAKVIVAAGINPRAASGVREGEKPPVCWVRPKKCGPHVPTEYGA